MYIWYGPGSQNMFELKSFESTKCMNLFIFNLSALTTQNKPLSSEQWIQNYGSTLIFEYIYDKNLG